MIPASVPYLVHQVSRIGWVIFNPLDRSLAKDLLLDLDPIFIQCSGFLKKPVIIRNTSRIVHAFPIPQPVVDRKQPAGVASILQLSIREGELVPMLED
jgi:hypothetical protein